VQRKKQENSERKTRDHRQYYSGPLSAFFFPSRQQNKIHTLKGEHFAVVAGAWRRTRKRAALIGSPSSQTNHTQNAVS
jgi:hypothetical protein